MIPPDKDLEFRSELGKLLNKYMRSDVEIPEFILAEYVLDCLHNFERAVNAREIYCGRDPQQKKRS